jgi:hypothetical protein
MQLCKRVGILCFPQRQPMPTGMATATVSFHIITYLHEHVLGNRAKYIKLSSSGLPEVTKNGSITISDEEMHL